MNQIVKQNEQNFKGTMENLKNTSKNLNQLTDSLNQMPLNSTIKNFEQTSADLKIIISRLELVQLVNFLMKMNFIISCWVHPRP